MIGNSRKASAPRSVRDPFLEALRDLGQETARVTKDELVGGVARDFLPEMFGLKSKGVGRRGELNLGESISFETKLAKSEAALERSRRQLFYERSLTREVEVVVEEDKQQLQLKIQTVRQEIAALAKNVVKLEEATKEAVLVAPITPGIYHETFFEKLKTFVINLRQTVERATLWVEEGNRRAKKKQMSYWGRYKKHGSKFFLSQEHYLTRSAG